MRRNAIIATALLAGATDLAAATGCAADNCLRALRATQIPGRLESAQAFCASYTTTSVPATAIPTFALDGCKKNQNGDLPARLSSACSCIAPATTKVPITTTSPTTTTQTAAPTTVPTGACAQVSASWAAQRKTAAAVPTVAASLAHECLNSVPVNTQAAIELLDSIEPYLEWQSDAAYKKDPPKDYFYPGYDMFANLARIKTDVKAGKYSSEYAYLADMYENVFGKGHDGHFVLYPDALSKAFRWRRQRSLVSISEDGNSLPVIKLYEDVIANPKTASVVKQINGIDAAKYVEDTINKAGYNQDVDSAYNSMFYEKSGFAISGSKGAFTSGGRIGIIYQGPYTNFTFANGTTLSLENKASVVGNFTGVIDGPSFYSKFCVPKPPNNSSSTPPASQPGNVPGYPQPVIATKDGVVAGYYLTGEGLEDVAVIVLTAFESESPAEFQAVTRDFLNEAVAAGKTKLVIDFQGNGGGYILQGYDFFRQLFPKVEQDGFSRWKGNDGFIAISHIFSDAVKDLNPATSDNEDLIGAYENTFNYRYDLNLTDQGFQTFEDKFAPHVVKDTPYTALMRWNLSDPLTTVNSTFGMGMDISGYGSLTNLSQPFKPENIVMLYDGVCASTCTIASEMLRIQGGVKSVAFGGRPIEGPIQGVGGVKGAQILQFSDILSSAQQAAQWTKDPEKLAVLNRYTALPIQRSLSAAVNVRDQILRDHVNDGLPAQFVAENVDCRLYWTAPMITDVTEVWKATAHAAFNGAKCAHGGISKPSASKRRAPPVRPISRPTHRTSELVDSSPRTFSENWLAMHLQKVVELPEHE